MRRTAGVAGSTSSDQLQPAARGGGIEQCLQPVEEGCEREVGLVELQPAGVDAREVEHVVDEREQGLGGIDHGVDIAALLAVERRVAQEACHAQHAVHRLANLVAHGGEERRPRAARGLGRIPLIPQPLDLGLHGSAVHVVRHGALVQAAAPHWSLVYQP